MIYNELKQHGTEDFPFALYHVDEGHPQYEMSFHWHTQVEFIRVFSGELEVTLDHRQYLLQAGDILFINSETVHGATPKNCRYACMVFNLAFLKSGNSACDEFIETLLAHGALPERPESDSTRALVYRIFDEFRQEDKGYPFKVMGLLHQLLGEIQQNGTFTAHLPHSSVHDEKKTLKLKAAIAYIRENYAESINLDDMAAVAGLSCKYFCKFFKSMTGTTPVNYLMAYRIERAARKLLSSDLSVTQIAYDCGFNDLSYFIKTFKAYRGVSPKEYRKR